jgi:DNA-binding NarL/FixJ family response regulator
MPASKGNRPASKILLVDDHAVFRDGLARIIEQEKDLSVCGEASEGTEALELVPRLKPDLIIVDVTLEGMSGIDLTKALRERFPEVRILVLSMHKESLYAERALRAGANGYIMKRETGRRLLGAMRHVLGGQTYISEELNQRILEKLSGKPGNAAEASIDRLSDRELEIFRLIGQGYGTRQMAEHLTVSVKTIESHKERIRAKLNYDSNFELVQHAIHWSFGERDGGEK